MRVTSKACGCARSEVQIADRSLVSLVITIKNCPHFLFSENALRCVLWWTCVALFYGSGGAITVGATRYPTTHPFVKRSIYFAAHNRPLASKAKAPIGGVTLKFLDLSSFINGCFCPSALGVCTRRESKKFQNLKLLMQLEGLKPRASEKSDGVHQEQGNNQGLTGRLCASLYSTWLLTSPLKKLGVTMITTITTLSRHHLGKKKSRIGWQPLK